MPPSHAEQVGGFFLERLKVFPRGLESIGPHWGLGALKCEDRHVAPFLQVYY